MGYAGNGSLSYSFCQLLNNVTDTKPTPVAFNGTGPAMKALIRGDMDYMCDQIVTAVPHVQSGDFRALAISSSVRSAVLPNVPTSLEAGLPQFRGSAWNALFAPKGTPNAIVGQLNDALSRALDDEATRQQLTKLGAVLPEGAARSPEALTALVNSEYTKWSGILLPIGR